MSRVEAAVTAVEDATAHWVHPVWNGSAEIAAEAALEAADAHDQANGIHRIALDDATVERAAKALHDTGEYADWDERDEGVKELYREDARTVIAALREGSGE